MSDNQQPILQQVDNSTCTLDLNFDRDSMDLFLQIPTPGCHTSSPPAALPQTRIADHPKIQNVISTANLCCQLNLRQIALRAPNVEYKPNRIGILFMRIREPRTTANIYGNGKIVCTGAKSVEESYRAVRKFARMIQKLDNPDVKVKNFRVRNMVASYNVGFRICLEGLHRAHQSTSSYNPELFPGLKYKVLDSEGGLTITIFASGTVVFIGAKDEGAVKRAADFIYPILKAHVYSQSD